MAFSRSSTRYGALCLRPTGTNSDSIQVQAAGTARKSFLSNHLENFAHEGIDSPTEFADLKTAALLLNQGITCSWPHYNTSSTHWLQAGGETTSSAVLLFLFAMLLNPEAQEKAQKEIDGVIGTTRLPDFSDRESLPFVECLMQETFRCYHPFPLGTYLPLRLQL